MEAENESRRTEIEGIATRLDAIGSELRQISVADALTKRPSDTNLYIARIDLQRARESLRLLLRRK
jgi:hypothetical protein